MDETLKALMYEYDDLAKQRAKLTDRMGELFRKITEHQDALRREQTADYKAYLQSDAWKSKAKAARRRAGNRCQLCNVSGVRLDTHHRTYERLGNELPGDLIVLCEACHKKFHGIEEAA